MRRGHCILTAFTFGLAFIPGAYAAEGIRASATAVSTVPADIAIVSFQIAEPVSGAPSASTGKETALRTAFEGNRIKVLEVSARHNSITLVNNPGREDDSALQKVVSFRLTGFRRIGDIAKILNQNGIRQDARIGFASSKPEAVIDDVTKEAIQMAIAKGKNLAHAAGADAGGVSELSVTSPADAWVSPEGEDLVLLELMREGEPQVKVSVTANVLLELRPKQVH